MNLRTTSAEVKQIIETDLVDQQIMAFITTANALVNDQLAAKGLGAELLTEIEKYLSAHLLSLRDQRAQSEGFGDDYRVTYQGKTDLGLNGTQYGQTVMMLDPTGKLAARSMGKKVARLINYGEDDD